jgi:hypothetical protein
MRKLWVAAAIVATVALGAPHAANAAPKRGFTVDVVCPSGTYQAVVPPGLGEWVPAIVIAGPARVLHPVGFGDFHARLIDPDTREVVDEFTEEGTQFRRNAHRHPHGFETCTFTSTEVIGPDDPEGLPEGFIVEFGGTVFLRAAPPRR